MASSVVQIGLAPLKRDHRGSVVEPLTPAELSEQRNVHVALTAPGAVRGNHYHERGTEVSIVYGPALIRYRDGDALRDVSVPAGEAYRVVIPPGVAHAIRHAGDEPGVIVSFNTEEHDPERPDTVPDEIL